MEATLPYSSVYPPEGRIRVFIVDDHPAIREALRHAITSRLDMEVCGEAASASDALRLIRQTDPTVAIVDVSLEDIHGLGLVQDIHDGNPNTAVIVFSMYDEQIYAERAIRAGAVGYLMKTEPTQCVVDAIRAVSQGDVYLSQRMRSRIASAASGRHTRKLGFAVDDFTEREMLIFEMLGEGYGIEEIASRLNISTKTVEVHRRRAKEKLGLNTVLELMQYVIRWKEGLVSG